MANTPRVVIKKTAREERAGPLLGFDNKAIRYTDSLQIREYREKAWSSYEKANFPASTEEPWRRTNLRTFPKNKWSISQVAADKSSSSDAEKFSGVVLPLGAKELSSKLLTSPSGTSLVTAKDHVHDGVVFTDLQNAEKNHKDLMEKILGKVVNPEASIFSALSGALAQYGALLYVPRNLKTNFPFTFLQQIAGESAAFLSHLLVYLDEGASATLLMETTSQDQIAEGLFVGTTEIYLGDNAELQLMSMQTLNDKSWNFTHQRAQLNKDSRLLWFHGATGSHLTKDFLDVDLMGEGSNANLYGAYLPSGDQHIDLDTQQNHFAPHTSSNLLYKGVQLQNGRSVWQGMIYVSPEAQQTDGYQLDQNLVLSSDARADAIPGLEILADDVRCSHGATIGKINDEEIFYLMSRGIPENEAKKLIIDGFFQPLFDNIKQETISERLQQLVKKRIDGRF